MPPSNRLFDDLARLMTDAAGAAQGVRREAETVVRAQLERVVRDLDMDMIRQVRNSWQFYRDRRPESYAAITKP